MGISVWQLAIVVLLVVLIFGTKKLKTLGSDLGESVKGFKKAIKDDDKDDAELTDLSKTKSDESKQDK